MAKLKSESLKTSPSKMEARGPRGLKSARDDNNKPRTGAAKAVPLQNGDQTRLHKHARKLSHYDAAGRAAMVDVSDKSATLREAEAYAFVAMNRTVLRALPQNPKGDPLEVARIAGIRRRSEQRT